MTQNKKARKNIYTHEIDLTNLIVKNAAKEEFRKSVEAIKYKGYEVETIKDGRRIIITKPGGKFSFGMIKREDFMVWVFNTEQRTLWLISHQNIMDDLEEKGDANPEDTIKIINALEEVYKGVDPSDVLKKYVLKSTHGESPEVILKAYKWIWGQEDVNYPDGKGRSMSWEGLKKNQRGEWEKTGKGIVDLRDRLYEKIKKASVQQNSFIQ